MTEIIFVIVEKIYIFRENVKIKLLNIYFSLFIIQ